MKICHLTSAHPQHDVRILLKECSSLAKHYHTTLIVVNGKNEVFNNVNIESVSCNFNSRLERFTKVVNLVLKKAIEIDADVYHIHDPELLRIVSKLKKLNKKVIYDVHEDLPRQILSKPWINILLRKLVSSLIEKYENWVAKKCDGIITATPFIKERFLKINPNTININNFPTLNELLLDIDYTSKTENNICYIGGISYIRGIEQMIKSLNDIEDVKLFLAGEFSSKELREKVTKIEGWKKVKEFGLVNREESIQIKKKSFIGLVLFLPEPNHINAQPNKMFEYMASGIAVIASNFPLWKNIIEKNNCGLCVNPLNPAEITNAIKHLLNNPEEAKIMGENGKRLVQEKYNWGNEEVKLLNLYNHFS